MYDGCNMNGCVMRESKERLLLRENQNIGICFVSGLHLPFKMFLNLIAQPFCTSNAAIPSGLLSAEGLWFITGSVRLVLHLWTISLNFSPCVDSPLCSGLWWSWTQ